MKHLGLIGFVCVTVLFATFMALSEISSHEAEEKNVEDQVLKMKRKYLYSELELMSKIDEQELTIMKLNHTPQALIDSTRVMMVLDRVKIIEKIQCELTIENYKASVQNLFDQDNEQVKKLRKECAK